MTEPLRHGSAPAAATLRRMQPLLGTFVEIRAAGDAARLEPAVANALQEVRRVHALMSYHADHSDVARINRAAAGVRVPVHPDTLRVLRFAQRLARLSAGSFDVAIAAVLVERGLLPLPACPGEPARLQGVAARGELELQADGSVRWRRRGLLDLGGIAKGYAVDCAIAALRRSGVACGLVNAGGDLRCFGQPQPIHVRAPDGAAVFLGHLHDGALATSGDSPQPAAGALVDPASGACECWGASISVAADDCMTADALTKIVRLAPQRAPRLLQWLSARAWRIEADGRLRVCGESHGGPLS